MKKCCVAIFGSTGSIGVNTLKVIDRYPDRFKVVVLTAFGNAKLLSRQIAKYAPSHVAVAQHLVPYLKRNCAARKIRISAVEEDGVLEGFASLPQVDTVVIAMQGAGALKPFLAAVRAGKTVAPANKEALVIAGGIIMREAQRFNAKVIPVDSEQSAIFQCLQGNKSPVRWVHLTASGGPLRGVPQGRFDRISVRDILRHPRWKMGEKITVDSATLMNKGFEVIEAMHLFGLSADQVKVVVHPEAIIHSMVEFYDGSILAQLGLTDMRLPIQYALSYPERLSTGLRSINFAALRALNFFDPDVKKFPALALAFYAARRGGTLPCVLNAADEEAVNAFLQGEITFTQIYKVVEKVVLKHKIKKVFGVEDILEADAWARREACAIITVR